MQLPPTDLPETDRHFLLYIPWQEKYLDSIPRDFKKYFLDCSPLLSVRTTDVHTATCFSYFDQLIYAYENNHNLKINRLVVGLALILHDTGWSQLSQSEIAASLGISGLKLNTIASAPKEKHAVEGEIIARQKLTSWEIPPDETNLICQCVRWHDKPQQVSQDGHVPPEVKLVVDLDHLWAFTHLNFWQDTVRKGISPEEYAANLDTDLEGYFVTQEGKAIAKELLEQRKKEIS